MAITQQQVDDWVRQREQLRSDLESLESGEMRVGEDRGQGWTDVTGAIIQRTNETIATYDAMIASAEKILSETP